MERFKSQVSFQYITPNSWQLRFFGYSIARVLRIPLIQFLGSPGWLNSGSRAASLECKGKPAGKKRPYAQV